MSTTTYGSFQDSGRGEPRAMTAAEEAVLARIHRYFEQAVRALPKRDQVKVLSAPDNLWTLMETLALAPVKESPELRVRLRGAIVRRELLESAGGVISPSVVAELLHISRQAVGQRRASGKLLGIETPGGYLYPVWQFDGLKILAGFEEVLAALADHDPWMQLIFFLRENDALGDEKPLDVLRQGKLDPVLRAARLCGVHTTV